MIQNFRSVDWKGIQNSLRIVQTSTASALKDLVMTDLENKTCTAIAHIRALTRYAATDEHGREVGDGLRQIGNLVCEMLSDESVIEAYRSKSPEFWANLQEGTGFCGPDSGGVSSDACCVSPFYPSTSSYDISNTFAGPASQGHISITEIAHGLIRRAPSSMSTRHGAFRTT